jgi:hypothetical protein
MSSGGTGAARELDRGTAAALDLLGRARRALAQGELPELGRLTALLESLRGQLDELPSAADRRLRQSLLALLDEAGVLAQSLREEQARLARQLRDGGVHRRAGAAYRRAGSL